MTEIELKQFKSDVLEMVKDIHALEQADKELNRSHVIDYINSPNINRKVLSKAIEEVITGQYKDVNGEIIKFNNETIMEAFRVIIDTMLG